MKYARKNKAWKTLDVRVWWLSIMPDVTFFHYVGTNHVSQFLIQSFYYPWCGRFTKRQKPRTTFKTIEARRRLFWRLAAFLHEALTKFGRNSNRCPILQTTHWPQLFKHKYLVRMDPSLWLCGFLPGSRLLAGYSSAFFVVAIARTQWKKVFKKVRKWGIVPQGTP